MKKTLLTIAIVMTMGFCASAQIDGFYKWNDADNEIFREGGESFDISLPSSHGVDYDSDAPLGSGLFILGALGAGYVLRKKVRS